MKRYFVILIAIIFTLPTMAQWNNQQAQNKNVAPSVSFQTTSTMPGSGSVYTSTPMLTEDGYATYNGASYSPGQSSGPRRIVTPGNDGVKQPLGDAMLPLSLLALAFAGIIYLRRRKSKTT